ncbi:MAG: hypothetical protein QXV01_07435 [Candidatus Bathyarchaeia archaeon]
MANPVPLFKTLPEQPLLAIFDEKGFFLSERAKEAYDLVKNSPHIYVARRISENYFYFGISKQVGGRWKRSHAYHLRGLACEILGTKRYDDQDHSLWVNAWFEPFQHQRSGPNFVIKMKEPVIISFSLQQSSSKKELKNIESRLIFIAKKKGLVVLNKKE